MGADYIDYIFADHFVVPEGRQSAYAEKIAWLPETFQANDRAAASANSRPPARMGFGGAWICLRAFNNTYKITPDVFDILMRLLRKVKAAY